MAESLLQSSTLFVVSGASRGFGRSVAETLVKHAASGSHFVLIARSQQQLESVASSLLSNNTNITCSSIVIDLASANFAQLSAALANSVPADRTFACGVLVHNAGTYGDMSGQPTQLTDKSTLDNFWALNLTSVYLLNAYWLAWPGLAGQAGRWRIINVSSLCAVQPVNCASMYCASKAARDMLFRQLPMETQAKTLNFAPGPLDTDMQAELRERTGDSETRRMWAEMHNSGKLLPCQLPALVLLRLIQRDEYKSGEHIDIYDVMNELLSEEERRVLAEAK